MSGPIDFDPEKTWEPLDRRITLETDPTRRALLEEVRDHMKAEINGDFDGLMATLIDEPMYHFWGVPIEGGPKGRAAVEAFYRGMMATGGNRFYFEVLRIFVDEGGVVTEGRMHQKIPTSAILASGISEVDGVPISEDAEYVAETQLLTVWPAGENGKLLGEDIYFGSAPLAQLRKLD